MDEKIRVVIAKSGLDGHERGAKVVARALRDAGMEVIYTGIRQTPEAIVRVAMQEDADVIALSVLSGAHEYLFPRVMELVREKGIPDVLKVKPILFMPDIQTYHRIGRRLGKAFSIGREISQSEP